MLTTTKSVLKVLEEELKKGIDAPLYSMLEKEDADQAKEKYRARKNKTTTIAPATCTGSNILHKSEPFALYN